MQKNCNESKKEIEVLEKVKLQLENVSLKKFYSFDSKIIATGTNLEKLNNLKKNFPNIIISLC